MERSPANIRNKAKWFLLAMLLPLFLVQFAAIEMKGLLGDDSHLLSPKILACIRSSSISGNCLKKVILLGSSYLSAVVGDDYHSTNSTKEIRCDNLKETERGYREVELEEPRSKFNVATGRLKQTFTMMPLKDLSQPGLTHNETNWFMSSLRRPSKDGKLEEFRFPSASSQERILCLQGNHTQNGTLNKYGFAWKDYLPENAMYLPGMTLVADNYWDYVNPWHSMSALVGFAAWRAENDCRVPDRIVAYHWGEIRTEMENWITNVLHASLGTKMRMDSLSSYGNNLVCFKDAVVHRRGIGGVSKDRMNRLFDMLRCKVHKFCSVTKDGQKSRFAITLLARSGAREFRNLSSVVKVV